MNKKRNKLCKWLQNKLYPGLKNGQPSPALINFIWAALHPLWWYVNKKQELLRYDWIAGEIMFNGKRYSVEDVLNLESKNKNQPKSIESEYGFTCDMPEAGANTHGSVIDVQ